MQNLMHSCLAVIQQGYGGLTGFPKIPLPKTQKLLNTFTESIFKSIKLFKPPPEILLEKAVCEGANPPCPLSAATAGSSIQQKHRSLSSLCQYSRFAGTC